MSYYYILTDYKAYIAYNSIYLINKLHRRTLSTLLVINDLGEHLHSFYFKFW